MKRATPKGETLLTKAVLDYLNSQRDVWAERRNSGSRPLQAKGVERYVKLGVAGTPDITGYVRRGQCSQSFRALPFGIEVKRPGQKLNANQKAWHAKAGEFGIPVAVCTSISEARAFIERLRKGEWTCL